MSKQTLLHHVTHLIKIWQENEIANHTSNSQSNSIHEATLLCNGLLTISRDIHDISPGITSDWEDYSKEPVSAQYAESIM